MPNEKDLKLWKYGISTERYHYLRAFCRQYKEWERHTRYGLNAVNNDGMPHGNTTSNPTEQNAFRNLKFADNIAVVETTCKEADAAIWKYILMNVAYGTTYELMGVPCGRRQFYTARRKFFYILDLKLP